MQRVDANEFEQTLAEYNMAVAQTPGISAFTTSSDWSWAAHTALHPPRELFAYREGNAWVVLATGALFGSPSVLQPLESCWSFVCPAVGREPRQVAQLLQSVLRRMSPDYPLTYLGGLPQHGALHHAIRQSLEGAYRVVAIPGCHSLQASLDGGVDGFMSRRSAKFRAEINRARRRACVQGFTAERMVHRVCGEALWQRVMAVEAATWKWQQGESIFQGEAAGFYQRMMQMAGACGRLRAVFFRYQGRDVAYAFGAVFAGMFRGLQMGYDHVFAQFSLGNLAQFELIEQSSIEALEWYDLGMVMDYKFRWADRQLNLTNLCILRN